MSVTQYLITFILKAITEKGGLARWDKNGWIVDLGKARSIEPMI